MLFLLFFYFFYNFTWISNCYVIRWNISIYNTSSTYDNIISNSYPWKHNYVSTYPHIISNFYRLCIF